MRPTRDICPPKKKLLRGPPRFTPTHGPTFRKDWKIEQIPPKRPKNSIIPPIPPKKPKNNTNILFHLSFLIGRFHRFTLVLKVSPLAFPSKVCPVPCNSSHICLIIDLLWCGSIWSINIRTGGFWVRYR